MRIKVVIFRNGLFGVRRKIWLGEDEWLNIKGFWHNCTSPRDNTEFVFKYIEDAFAAIERYMDWKESVEDRGVVIYDGTSRTPYIGLE